MHDPGTLLIILCTMTSVAPSEEQAILSRLSDSQTLYC